MAAAYHTTNQATTTVPLAIGAPLAVAQLEDGSSLMAIDDERQSNVHGQASGQKRKADDEGPVIHAAKKNKPGPS